MKLINKHVSNLTKRCGKLFSGFYNAGNEKYELEENPNFPDRHENQVASWRAIALIRESLSNLALSGAIRHIYWKNGQG